MTKQIISSARVPREMYIEREADSQLQRIIRDMARPGYVLVARQMGKTNLLLHTKDLLENETDIFVYVDFSTMSDYTEQECLNFMIDTAIEVNYKVFSDAEDEISELRAKRGYNAAKFFSRELRILLKYVNKIVFILDEIDALTRRDYSDRVFSLIRGHYYANTNFPELKRATFIMSGVIEPKDIIKDPNISPFNIGEKIYLTDFNYNEFRRLVFNSEFLRTLPEIVIERMFFWSNGQPRISWDICASAEQLKVSTTEDVDAMIRHMYLTRFDKAPIDSIRDIVKSDEELRDALIQLSINKGNELSADINNRLYLAGIIDYKQQLPKFKNPIMEQSLTYDWLISIRGKEIDYLADAINYILCEDYKKAITLLISFLGSNKTKENTILEAEYWLSFAYYRTLNVEEALKHLESLEGQSKDFKYYYETLFLNACCLISIEDWKQSEKILRDLISNSSNIKDDKLFLQSNIYLASVLIEVSESNTLREAQNILINLVNAQRELLLKHQLLATLFYYLSVIEQKNGEFIEAVKYLDTAIISAQLNEKPRLLYQKLQCTTEKETCADELYNSLKSIRNKPEAEYFDNPLAFNTIYACFILAELMLSYPQYDVTKYLRLFLYDSKESAVIFIYRVLNENDRGLANKFFGLIETLIENDNWHFQLSELIILANIQLVNFDKHYLSDKVVETISISHESLPTEVQELSSNLIFYYLNTNNLACAQQSIINFRSYSNRIIGLTKSHRLFIDYINCLILYRTDRFIDFEKAAGILLKQFENYTNGFTEELNPKISVAGIKSFISTLEQALLKIASNKRQIGIDLVGIPSNVGRNTKIRVRYLFDGHEDIGKYKQYKRDIDLGICIIVEIIS